MSSKDTLHFDGDVLLYTCAFAAQHTYYDLFREDVLLKTFECAKDAHEEIRTNLELGDCLLVPRVEVKDFSVALNAFNQIVKQAKEALNTKKYTITLSGSTNFRDEVGTLYPYKGNRRPEICEVFGKKAPAKPHYYQPLKSEIAAMAKTTVVEGIEADDWLGIQQYKDLDHSIIATTDKDLNQIEGRHFDISEKWKYYTVSKAEGYRWIYAQVMMGDYTDGVPGIKGFGLSGALKAVKNSTSEKELFGKSLERWKSYAHHLGGTDEDAVDMMVETGKLVYIHRSEDFEKEVTKFERLMEKYEA